MTTIQKRNKVFLDLPSAIEKATFIKSIDCYNIIKIEYHQDFGVIDQDNKDYFWFSRKRKIQEVEKYTELLPQPMEKERIVLVEATNQEMPIYCYIVLDNLEFETWYEHDGTILWDKINSEADKNIQIEIMTIQDLETLTEQEYLLKKNRIQEQEIARQKWILENLEIIKASVEKTILRQKPKTGSVRLSKINDEDIFTQTQNTFSFGQLQIQSQIMTSYKLQTK